MSLKIFLAGIHESLQNLFKLTNMQAPERFSHKENLRSNKLS